MSQIPGVPADPQAESPTVEPEPPAAPAEPAAPPEASSDSGTTHRRAFDRQASRPGVIEAVADLLQYIVDWLRQEATAIVHDRIVLPLQKLGLTLASGCAAAFLAALGIGFIAVGVFMLLGQWLTYPGALLLTGGILVLGAIVFTVIKMRSFQK